jgi:hypothetical protein
MMGAHHPFKEKMSTQICMSPNLEMPAGLPSTTIKVQGQVVSYAADIKVSQTPS